MATTRFADLLLMARQMVAALRVNVDRVSARGVDRGFVERGAQMLAALEAADVEQERLKAELHSTTARVEALATSLLSLGVRRGDTVGLISDNRPEWILCDLACVCVGAPDVPRGSDSTAKEIEYILGHADTVAAFVEDGRQLAKVLAFRGRLPLLRFLVVMDPAWAGPAAPARPSSPTRATTRARRSLPVSNQASPRSCPSRRPQAIRPRDCSAARTSAISL